MKKRAWIISLFAGSLICAGIGLSGVQTSSAESLQQKESRTSISVHSDDDHSNWIWSENGKRLEVKLKGKIEFTENYSDIKTLSPNGYFTIKDERTSVERKFEVEADAGGHLKRSYFIEGRAATFDGEAERWLSELLLEAVRQAGFDAPARAERLFRQGGANAVLDEISKIRSDYVKKLYFTELLEKQRLDSASVQRAVRQVGREISSDYEKSQVLSKVAKNYLDDKAVLSEFVEATTTISSDYERGRALAILLKRDDLNDAQLRTIFKSITGMSSDYEKAGLLIKLIDAYKQDYADLPTLFEVVGGIHSDYERSRVLLTLLGKENSGKESLKLAIKAAASISSDYEKARVLMRVASLNKGDEEIRRALSEAAKTIGSEYERGRVLSATFK